ncbi:MAG: PAS domain S-box protein [Parvibaculum sp.]
MALQTDATTGEFFRNVVESLPEAIIVATPEGRMVYVNAALVRLLGYGEEELLGQPISKLVPQQPGRRAEPMKWLTRWASENDAEQSRFLDLIGRAKDGREMAVGVRVREGSIGADRRYFISIRDRTVARDDLVRSKEAQLLSARILAVAADAIVAVDQDQKINFFNLTAERLFGYADNEVLGQPLEMLMPERFRKKHHLEVSAFGTSKQASRYMNERGRVVGRRKDGSEFPVEATITKVTMGGQSTFVAHIRDVTARTAREKALVESERRFHAIFDHAYEAIGLLDPAGTVLEINRAGRALTEDSGGLIGQPLWDLPWIGRQDALDDEGRTRLKDAVQKAANGEVQRFNVDIHQPSGVVQIDLSLTPVRGENGAVVYIIPEGRDVAKLG